MLAERKCHSEILGNELGRLRAVVDSALELAMLDTLDDESPGSPWLIRPPAGHPRATRTGSIPRRRPLPRSRPAIVRPREPPTCDTC